MDDDSKLQDQRGVKRNAMSDAAMQYFRRGDQSQKRILEFILSLTPLKSAVDFGTGNGYWLAAAKAAGVTEIQGFDLADVKQDELKIPLENFTSTDLGQPIELPHMYDLVISTEVAEHVPLKNTRTFIDNICNAGDLVLFSAAIPYQGGRGHQNEMWAEYWAKLFQDRGFLCYDILRSRFWHDGSIRSYYRQNLLLFARGEMETVLDEQQFTPTKCPPSLIHPEQYLKVIGYGLPPEMRSIADDVTQYYDCVTKSPEELDEDQTRKVHKSRALGWEAVMKHFGP